VPAGSVNEAMDSGAGGLIVIEKSFSSDCGTESVTRSLKENVPALVGVPERLPVEALRLRPGGREPLITPHTSVPIPPVAETV